MNTNKIQARYFEKMLLQAEGGKMTEEDLLQLYQDMADTGYAFTKEETSIHCRLLMMKGILKIPKNYTLVPVQPEEVMALRNIGKKATIKHTLN